MHSPIVFAVVALGAMTVTVQAATKSKIFAQTLVQQTLAMHPEVTEIGISVRSSRGCRSIASTDPGDVGEKCEQGDLAVMRTRKASVQKERDGFDVTLPLHDAKGTLLGSVGMEFGLRPGQTRAGVIKQATMIAKAMEAQIPTRASLYRR